MRLILIIDKTRDCNAFSVEVFFEGGKMTADSLELLAKDVTLASLRFVYVLEVLR